MYSSIDMVAKLELYLYTQTGVPVLKPPEYPDGHKLMQDNDPEHTSGYASSWMIDNRVN